MPAYGTFNDRNSLGKVPFTTYVSNVFSVNFFIAAWKDISLSGSDGCLNLNSSMAEDKPARRARAPRAPKTKLEDLVTDVEIQGTVRSVQSYGAFVDIGAETDGLLHVSEISNEYVKDATEKLNVGDAVTVRVKMVNMEKKQARLTSQRAPPSQSSTRACPSFHVWAGREATPRTQPFTEPTRPSGHRAP